VSCTATTELSTSCEIAAVILSSSLVRHRALSLAAVEPPLGPGPLNAPGLLCVLVVDGHISGMPQRSPPRGAVSQQ
jgi:hypothetical protein